MNLTLTDYTPVVRYDGTAWTSAQMFEAADPDGPWTLIETFVLEPVDADPENPETRDFTTTNATLETGWYQIVWVDDFLNESSTPAVQNVSVVRAYRPLVSDVAEVIRMRTVDSNGVEQGTFTAGTRPTYEEVERIIDRSMWKLEAKFGPEMPQELVGSAAEVVSLRAAMMIELTYFGDQVSVSRSPYTELKALYEEALQDWFTERRSLGADETPDTADDTTSAAMPVAQFPPPPTRVPSDSRTGLGLGWEGVIW